MALATDELIENGLSWFRASRVDDALRDVTPADARLETRTRHEQLPYGGVWDYTEWTVIIGEKWAVDLDGNGLPEDPPRRIR